MSSFGKKGESYNSVSRISVAFINLIIVRKLIYSYKLTFSQDHLRSTLGIICGTVQYKILFQFLPLVYGVFNRTMLLQLTLAQNY